MLFYIGCGRHSLTLVDVTYVSQFIWPLDFVEAFNTEQIEILPLSGLIFCPRLKVDT